MVEAYALYILETLMSSHNCMPLSNLWTCFTSRFPQNAEFLSIVGPDMGSFERYLKSHPLLFKVNNFVVTLTDNYDGEYDSSLKLASTDYKIKPRKHETIFEFNFEQEAIKYFQKILINEKEKWITIESLESHLDQASNKIRLAIGPTRDFPAFLNRHPLVFEIQGDLVGLKEEYKNACIQGKNPLNSSNTSSTTIENQPASANVTLRNKKLLFKKEKNSIVKPNPTPPSVGNRRTTIYCDGMADFMTLPQGNYSKNRPYSMAEYTPNAVILNQENMLTNNQSIQKKNSVIALSISEFKSISWLRSILLTKSLDGTMSTTKLMQNLVEASESIHGTIGTTQVELVEFISKHPLLFNFNENTRILSMKSINMIHLIIIEDRQTENETYSLTFKKGCVFCITKLWGIIDLGFHEHVFFDRSLFKNVTDLTKHFKTGEALYFNAVLAAKESRAKWRAIRVWKETDKVAAQLACRQNLGYTNYQNTENGLIVTGPSEWDTDSGYDNVVDEYLSQTRKSNYPIDPNTIHQDSDLFSLLFVETVNLPECLSAFSSIRLADPWEVSSIIAQGPESLAMLDGNKSKSPIEANKTDDRCSSIASSLSESEMNTMSGVPSLAQQDAQDYNGKLDEKMSTLSITSSGYASKSSKLLQPVKYQKDTTSVGNCAATQTVFTGDIMATQLFHEDTQPTPV